MPRRRTSRDREIEDGQRLQPEEVELHQPRLLDPFHVELGDLHARARIAIERHQLVERPVADDDAGGMGRGVAIEALELLGDGEQPLDHRVLLARRPEARLVGDRLLERHRVGRVLRHHLGEPVDLAIGHLQDAADVAKHGARLQRAEGDDLRHLVGAVFLPGRSAITSSRRFWQKSMSKSGIDTRSGLRKRSKRSAEAERVEVGDGERPGDHRAGAGAAARTDRDPLPFRPLDEVGDDQEIARIFHPLDDAELVFEPLAIVLLGQARREAVRGEPAGRGPACASTRRSSASARFGFGGIGCPPRRSAAGSASARAARTPRAWRSRPCCRSPRAGRRTAPPSRRAT